jgi:delta1-piperideine-2-carboxylate reductase
MMIELLSAALTGGNFSFEFDWSGYNGAQTPHTGQLVIVIDPMRGWGAPFRERAEHLVRQMRGAGLSVLPGERRYRRRREISEAGVLPISSANLAQLRTLAE